MKKVEHPIPKPYVRGEFIVHERTCPECDGEGRIETFEDRWSYASDSHYTVSTYYDCDECGCDGYIQDEECECPECCALVQ